MVLGQPAVTSTPFTDMFKGQFVNLALWGDVSIFESVTYFCHFSFENSLKSLFLSLHLLYQAIVSCHSNCVIVLSCCSCFHSVCLSAPCWLLPEKETCACDGSYSKDLASLVRLRRAMGSWEHSQPPARSNLSAGAHSPACPCHTPRNGPYLQGCWED